MDEQIALPLSASELRFVEAYISCRDVAKAAVEAGYPSKDGVGLYRRKAINAEITRRSQPIEAEIAKAIVKKRTINVEMLDSNLKQVINIPRKILEATPSLATPKVNAIEMGYKRVGLLLDGNFVPDAASGADHHNAPDPHRDAPDCDQPPHRRAIESPRAGDDYPSYHRRRAGPLCILLIWNCYCLKIQGSPNF